MRKTVRLTHDSQVRSNDVTTAHSSTWDAAGSANDARVALNGHVTESTRLLAVRARAIDDRKAAVQQCRVCRIALRAADRTIVRVGKLVNEPSFQTDTLTPAAAKSDADLQTHMQVLHDRVLPFQDAFVKKGMPADTLGKVADGIKALEAARAAVAATVQDAASADQALSENQRQARAAILALEAMVPGVTPEDREVLKKLQVARRVGPRTTQPDHATSTTPAPSTPASPTAAPATSTSPAAAEHPQEKAS
jgi:hypothetical protein